MIIKNKDLKRRIINISYKYNLSHLSSCLTAVDIIDDIYKIKKPDEKFVLSQGQAGLALYTVIEKYLNINAEDIWKHHGTHPDKCDKCHLDCSTGSLGQGLSIAVGMALADRNKNVYCLTSDGELNEGVCWEAIRLISDKKINNLKLYINWNNYTAYDKASEWVWEHLSDTAKVIETNVDYLPFLKGIDAHYHKLTEEEYKLALEILK